MNSVNQVKFIVYIIYFVKLRRKKILQVNFLRNAELEMFKCSGFMVYLPL